MGGQSDDMHTDRRGSILPTYYVCSPSAPPFIPSSPLAPPPSHYPYLYADTYPQLSPMLSVPPPNPACMSGFLMPTPMSQFVLTISGDKIPVEALAATRPPPPQEKPKQSKWRYLFTFTVLISLAQVIYFIMSVVRAGIVPVNENINIGPPTWVLVDMGAKVAYLIRYDHELWRFIVPVFLHGGVVHILLNLVAQVRLGVMMENEWGRSKFLAIYFLSGVGSVLMSCLIQPNNISVGASGAIVGMVGAYFADIILVWKQLSSKTKKIQVCQAGFILVVIGLLTLVPHVDSSAHFGGLVVGFLLGLALLPSYTNPIVIRRARVIFLALVMLYFAIGFWYFFTVMKPQVLIVPRT